MEKALAPDHANVALFLNNLAVLYYNKGEYAKAEPLLQRALATQATWSRAQSLRPFSGLQEGFVRLN